MRQHRCPHLRRRVQQVDEAASALGRYLRAVRHAHGRVREGAVLVGVLAIRQDQDGGRYLRRAVYDHGVANADCLFVRDERSSFFRHLQSRTGNGCKPAFLFHNHIQSEQSCSKYFITSTQSGCKVVFKVLFNEFIFVLLSNVGISINCFFSASSMLMFYDCLADLINLFCI